MSDFSKRGKYLQTYCRPCSSLRFAEWQDKNREKRSAYNRRWYASQPDRAFKVTLRRHHLTKAQYHQLLDEQGNACAICRVPFTGPATVDHDHSCCPGLGSCGRCIRGLLCQQCNVALGMFHDSLQSLATATEYLQRARPLGPAGDITTDRADASVARLNSRGASPDPATTVEHDRRAGTTTDRGDHHRTGRRVGQHRPVRRVDDVEERRARNVATVRPVSGGGARRRPMGSRRHGA